MTAGERASWTVSIVSHGHGRGVLPALRDAHAQLTGAPHHFVLTLNAGEDPAFVQDLPEDLRARLRVIANPSPRGYAANHNAALRGARSDYVLIADPDLSLPMPVFDAIEARLADACCGIVAPQAETPAGAIEDNGRALVTPAVLLKRYLLAQRWYAKREPPRTAAEVDWLAGLFMAMRTDTFHRLGGFDERYYLYCEDVDLCLRARALGLSVLLLGDLRVSHTPKRGTLKQVQHFMWHVQSLLRLWFSEAYRAARSAHTPPPAPSRATTAARRRQSGRYLP